jgi:hypothetical protein
LKLGGGALRCAGQPEQKKKRREEKRREKPG